MAAPASKNIKELNGKWLINKTHSDATDPVLALQGIGWLTRKALGLATVTQHTKTYTQAPTDNPTAGPVLHIDFDQVATGGIKGTSEHRACDWKPRPHSDWLFGDLMGKSRVTTLAALEEEAKKDGAADGRDKDVGFMLEGWLEETVTGEVVEGWVDNEGKGWTGWQVWGFSEVNGERWFTRRFSIRKKGKDEVVRIKLVYEWVGELDS